MKQPVGSVQACHYRLQKDCLDGCFPSQKMKLRLYVIFKKKYQKKHRRLITVNFDINFRCSDPLHASSFYFDVTQSYQEIVNAYSYYENRSVSSPNDFNRFEGDYYQVWDEYFWMTPEKGQLLIPADICWEQKTHVPTFGGREFPRYHMKHMGLLLTQKCKTVMDVTFIANKSVIWPGTDWENSPGIRWVAPNNTRWICGYNLWPWLPVGWVGRCTLGFVFAPEGFISKKLVILLKPDGHALFFIGMII